jgi:hypothetical protein
MRKQIDGNELKPEPANEQISIDLSSLYEFGQYALDKQNEYAHENRPDVQGFYIKDDTYGATLGTCQKINEEKENVINLKQKRLDVFDNLATIAKFCINRGLPAFLIEISIYDARDNNGNQFYTYVYSQSDNVLTSYIREVQNNIDLDKDENSDRGLIIPSSSFYKYPYLATQLVKKSPTTIDPEDKFKPSIFVGGGLILQKLIVSILRKLKKIP